MKDMIKRLREKKGGFTLAELLIVVAIVLVLVAIAVPVFTSALGNAEEAVGNANIRSVKSTAAVAILMDEDYEAGANQTWTATAKVSESGTISEMTVTEGGNAESDEKAVKDGDGGWDVTAVVTETDLPSVNGTAPAPTPGS